MWLLPGINFLRYICSLDFTRQISNEIFDQFYANMQNTLKYLYSSKDTSSAGQMRSKKTNRPVHSSPGGTKHASDKLKRNAVRFSRIQQLESMDRGIDRRRFEENLIGRIIKYDKGSAKMPTIPTKMAEDLAHMKIRNFHKMNLLSRGQFATSKSNDRSLKTRSSPSSHL